MKKKLFRKVATVTVATILGVTTIMGSTLVLAAKNSNIQEAKIESLSAYVDIEGGLDPRAEGELLKAFTDKMTIYNDDESTRYRIEVKDFKYFGEDAYITKLTTNKTIYEGKLYDSNSKQEQVVYDVVDKYDNGHPAIFELSFDNKSEHITPGDFNVEIKSGEESTSFEVQLIGTECLEERGDIVGPGEVEPEQKQTDKKEEVKNDVKSDADKKTETVKPTEKATEKPTVKPTDDKSKDKTPKTGDEMSTGIVIAMVLGSVSVVSLAGVYIYKRRKING